MIITATKLLFPLFPSGKKQEEKFQVKLFVASDPNNLAEVT